MNASPLPDAALTIYRLEGMAAVCRLVGVFVEAGTVYDCPRCDGDGWFEGLLKTDHPDNAECKVCGGTGAVRFFTENDPRALQPMKGVISITPFVASTPEGSVHSTMSHNGREKRWVNPRGYE